MLEEELKIATHENWDLYLHPNQYYLGRSYLWAKRENAIDFICTTQKERKEFFYVSGKLINALKKNFSPDIFNYASLGNVDHHLHVHIIPRYKQFQVFSSKKFFDDKWGTNYSPHPPDDTNHQIKLEIIKAIRNYL